jgi:hypothetical protein
MIAGGGEAMPKSRLSSSAGIKLHRLLRDGFAVNN